MTKKRSTVCDGNCGEEGTGDEPRGWFHLNLEIYGQDSKDTLDFCSFECVSRWAARRANELKNP